MNLVVRPTTIRAATAFIDRWHSHHEPPRGGAVAVSVCDSDRVACVAVLGRPVSIELSKLSVVGEVTRAASDGSAHGAASLCLRAIADAAMALGYRRLVSYTLLGERGTSYRKAGWRVTGLSEGGEWSRPSRPRAAAAQPGAKVRWEFGPDALPRDRAAWSLLWKMAARVDLPRRKVQPLLSLGGLQ